MVIERHLGPHNATSARGGCVVTGRSGRRLRRLCVRTASGPPARVTPACHALAGSRRPVSPWKRPAWQLSTTSSVDATRTLPPDRRSDSGICAVTTWVVRPDGSGSSSTTVVEPSGRTRRTPIVGWAWICASAYAWNCSPASLMAASDLGRLQLVRFLDVLDLGGTGLDVFLRLHSHVRQHPVEPPRQPPVRLAKDGHQ